MDSIRKVQDNIKHIKLYICNPKHKKNKLYSELSKINKELNKLQSEISKIIPANFTYDNKHIVDNLPINVNIIDDIDDIPDNPLYWVSSINQFAVSINGVIFRGNVGNIYNKQHIHNNDNNTQTIICKFHNTCPNLNNNKMCKFYHDPHELLSLLNNNSISEDLFDEYKKTHRNFINTSWIYTDNQNNKKNINMRHFGSKNSLYNEFELMKLNKSPLVSTHVDNYKHQTIHDILIILGLDSYDLI
jgi:hypothetical protein